MLINSRRNFFKTSFLITLIVIVSGKEVFGFSTPLETLAVVQTDLFPHAKTLKSNAFNYLHIVFNHSKISKSDKKYLRNGVKWLNEEAVLVYRVKYIKLNPKQRQDILKNISKQKWGESWIETVMTYMLEAMLGDPIYGINKNEAGWKWLNHSSGLPRPKEALL